MLWKAEIDGQPTTMDDMENYSVVLFIAGLDTVMNGIGHGIRYLATDLALQERLRATPEMVGDAPEERLRRCTLAVPPRVIGNDANIGRAGSRETWGRDGV